MDTIPGIEKAKILLSAGGGKEFSKFPTNAGAHLGKIPVGRIRVQLELSPSPVFVFVVDGQKQPTLLKEIWTASGIRRVVKDMGIKQTENKIPYIGYPENHLRLVEASTSRIRMWELAIISQEGEFFFTSQQTFDVTVARRLGGRLFICSNRLHAWPQMIEFLRILLGEPIFPLKEEAEKNSPPPGTVLWWNVAQGLGAIQTPRGVARAHWSQVALGQRVFQYLREGERVFCEIKEIAQRAGARPTSFKWEAKNIKPLM